MTNTEDNTPYLWRYRDHEHGEIDMLLLPTERDRILTEHGETTIVTWEQND